MRINIYTTGGSIDKCYNTQDSNFQVGEPAVGWMLTESNTTLDITVIPVCRKDSLEITQADRDALRERILSDDVRHVLVTHGTDTMAETARSLLKIPNKVIVLTGAMQPAAFKHSDAPFNIGCAIGVLQCKKNGVYLVMNGKVFNPKTVTKNVAANRFEHYNGTS